MGWYILRIVMIISGSPFLIPSNQNLLATLALIIRVFQAMILSLIIILYLPGFLQTLMMTLVANLNLAKSQYRVDNDIHVDFNLGFSGFFTFYLFMLSLIS